MLPFVSAMLPFMKAINVALHECHVALHVCHAALLICRQWNASLNCCHVIFKPPRAPRFVKDGRFEHSYCRTVCSAHCLCLRRCVHTVSRQIAHILACCLSSLPSNDLITPNCMASHMSESENTSLNTCFSPLPTNAFVLSHPVDAWIPGISLQTSSPRPTVTVR